MEIKETDLQGVYILENFYMPDIRGSFNKIFNSVEFEKLDMKIKEVYYSISNKNVIRGLHFQNPPFAQDKIVTIIKGKVIDVIVDIRRNSKTYGKYIAIELSRDIKRSIFIPKGFAHGFKALEDDTHMLYLTSETYKKECDDGIKWNSIEFDWGIQEPITSERDQTFKDFKDYISSF